MSEIRVNRVVNSSGADAPNFPYGFSVAAGYGITGGGNVVATAATFSGAVNVDATTDSTSSSTGALIVDGGLGVAKNVYIGAGLSVAGTLTYEDVTNVDSVGLITAKSGVNVSGGQLTVGVAYSVGAAGVATALGFVAGTSGFSGDINITANNSTNETVYPVFVDGATGVQGLESDTGLTYNPSSGNLGIGGELAAASLDISGSADIDGTMEADAITVNGTALNTVIAGVTVTNATTAANVTVADESSDTTCFPTFVTAATGNLPPKSGSNLTFNASSGALTAASFVGSISGGSVSGTTGTFTGDLFLNNGSDAGKDLTWDVSADALIFNDTVYASFGSDQDMSIWHDGSNSYMQNTTGSMYIRPKSGEDGITIVPDAGVSLSHNNLARLETTNDGVKITGIGTFTQGANFDGILSEKFNETAGKLSDNTNIDLADGMIHFFTTTESTTCTPNIRYNSSKSLNNMLNIGDSVTVTVITSAAAAGYSANWNVDGSGVTEEWNGGSAPSEGGAGGYDCYTITLLKRSNASFTVLANVSNFA